jgi:hypothetical protein
MVTAEGPLIAFWPSMALAYLVAALLASGINHVVRFGSFRDVVRGHGLIPLRFTPLVALLTVVAEIGLGSAALIVMPQRPSGAAVVVLAGAAALGLAFVGYMRRLLRAPGPATSCGCTPFSGPLTRATLLPGAMLALVSTVGGTATWVATSAADPAVAGPLRALAALWGVSLAVTVMLVPASIPQPATDRSP